MLAHVDRGRSQSDLIRHFSSGLTACQRLPPNVKEAWNKRLSGFKAKKPRFNNAEAPLADRNEAPLVDRNFPEAAHRRTGVISP